MGGVRNAITPQHFSIVAPQLTQGTTNIEEVELISESRESPLPKYYKSRPASPLAAPSTTDPRLLAQE